METGSERVSQPGRQDCQPGRKVPPSVAYLCTCASATHLLHGGLPSARCMPGPAQCTGQGCMGDKPDCPAPVGLPLKWRQTVNTQTRV